MRPNFKPFLLLLLLPLLIAGVLVAIEDFRTTVAYFENNPDNMELLKIYGVGVAALLIGYVTGWAVGFGKGQKRGINDRRK